jgi:ribonuclease R
MTRRGSSTPPPNTHKRGSAAPPKDWRGEDPNLELEKSRYADPIASRELLLKHLAEAPEPLSAARLAKRLGLNTDRSATRWASAWPRWCATVRRSERTRLQHGRRSRARGGQRARPASGEVLIMPDDGSAPLVLARADSATLMHNDRVEVRRLASTIAAGAWRA